MSAAETKRSRAAAGRERRALGAGRALAGALRSRPPILPLLAALASSPLLPLGCASESILRIELTDYPLDYGFFVVWTEDGGVSRVTEPFGLAAGRLTFGAPTALTLRPGEAGVALVGLDRAALEGTAHFDPSRAPELALRVAPPPDAPHLESPTASPSTLLTRLPASAKLWAAAGAWAGALEPLPAASAPWLGALTLHVPVDPEHCRVPGERALVPYTSERDALTGLADLDPALAPHVRRLVALDEGRVLALTRTHAVLLRRGARATDPASALHLPARATALLRSLAVAPDRGAGPRAVAVAGGVELGHAGWVWELELDGDALHLVRTTTLAEDVGSAIFDPEGRTFVSTATGAIYARDPGAAALRPAGQLELYADDPDDLATLHATGDAAYPLLAASRARLHVYDAALGRWTSTHLVQEGITAAKSLVFHALASARRDDGALELWAASQRGYLFRKIGGDEWDRVKLDLPPRFALCGSLDEATDTIHFDDTWDALAIGAGYVHLVARQCSAVVQVRRSDLCTSLLSDGEPPSIRDQRFAAIVASSAGIVVAGDDGVLLEARWP